MPKLEGRRGYFLFQDYGRKKVHRIKPKDDELKTSLSGPSGARQGQTGPSEIKRGLNVKGSPPNLNMEFYQPLLTTVTHNQEKIVK